MKIEVLQAGKRFNREWIFRNATARFLSGTAYAITGANGSGKSTLLQCLGSFLRLSEGNISYELDGKRLDEWVISNHVSFCAPYLELIEEMNLIEFLSFHGRFKPFIKAYPVQEVIRIIGLQPSARKQIRYYSSGMKQRVKLAQAILSDTAVVLLDEPCTNLDAEGISLYHQLIQTYTRERLVVVSSNDEEEYKFCSERITIQSFKNAAPSSLL